MFLRRDSPVSIRGQNIKGSEMVCCQQLASKQSKEEIYVEGQPSMSYWSLSVLNMQGGRSSLVESQSLSRLRRVPKWGGCTVWGIKAQES